MNWGCLYWRRGALRDMQVMSLDIDRAAFGEIMLELLCVGLGGRTIQGSVVGGGGKTWLRETGCTGG